MSDENIFGYLNLKISRFKYKKFEVLKPKKAQNLKIYPYSCFVQKVSPKDTV